MSFSIECKKKDSGETSQGNSRVKSFRAGFTLIEVLVAICLIGIALLSMTSLTTMVIKGNAYSKTRTTATTLAKDKLEELKNTSYSNLPSSGTDYAASTGAVQASATGAYYTREWEIEDSVANVKNVTVTVSWPWQGSERNVALKTMVSR
ncbi:hypothetical membrane protein [Syntrophus aciditrophicus SB]|uniref:Hypothetical membrane protein n=2 Tax=Syntrophus TaxID=43773 RepID=Q2LVV9_SYNAS|nr:hypothetical membrane protein [Syntrophus aciditrophicus SB]